jgi:thiol-disulfide isomerase/thioredoxin
LVVMRIRFRAPLVGPVLALLAVVGCGHPKAFQPEVKAVTASELVASATTAGAPTVLLLYASWCHACQHELPQVNGMMAAYTSRGVRFVAASFDDDGTDFDNFYRKMNAHFAPLRVLGETEALVGPAKAAKLTYDGHIPYLAVIDRAGAPVHDWPATASTMTDPQLDEYFAKECTEVQQVLDKLLAAN